LGTKVLSEANVRAKPMLMEFDRLITQAEAQLKARPLRTSLSDIEINRIAELFCAHELQADEELRVAAKSEYGHTARWGEHHQGEYSCCERRSFGSWRSHCLR
jgi:hypothetical protein